MILFRRAHKQYNLISPDRRQTTVKIDGTSHSTTFDTGIDHHDYKEEVFEIEWMETSLNNFHYTWKDSEISEIIESSNYFTFISKDKTEITVYRYEDVSSMKFKLKEPLI